MRQEKARQVLLFSGVEYSRDPDSNALRIVPVFELHDASEQPEAKELASVLPSATAGRQAS